MSKYRSYKSSSSSDNSAEQIAREMLPALRAQRDALIAEWGDQVPENPTRVFSQTYILPALTARFGTEYSAVKGTVQALLCNDLEKEILKIVRARQVRAQQAAEALIDRNRPVVATHVSGTREPIGAFVIADDHILVCIESGYVESDPEDERESGWYASYAEPTADEMQTAAYQTIAQTLADDQARDQRIRAQYEARRQADLDAIRAEGREPTRFEDLFAGASDN